MGFALALAAGWAGRAGLILVTARTWSGEEGACSPRGVQALGIDLSGVLAVHVRTGQEALWASEQALEMPGATVVCAFSDAEADLTASRRLLLKAEKSRARAVLVRAMRSGETAMASAAHTRWRIAPRPSTAPGRLLGAPAWRATLVRRRGGAPGAVYDLTWNAHARAFERIATPQAAGDLAAVSGDRPLGARPFRAA